MEKNFEINLEKHPRYKLLERFYGSNLFVVYDNCSRRFGYVDENGNFVIECKYVGALPFIGDDAITLVQERYADKWGVINKNDELILPYRYYHPEISFCNGIALVQANSRSDYKFIDKNGNEKTVSQEDDDEFMKKIYEKTLPSDSYADLIKKIENIANYYSLTFTINNESINIMFSTREELIEYLNKMQLQTSQFDNILNHSNIPTL